MNIRTVVAKRLKMLRKSRNLTQEQLAELVNVAPRHISFIETGRSFPSGDLIERICTVLNIEFTELFYFDKQPAREELISTLNNTVSYLDDKKLEFLVKMAKEL